MAKGDMLPCNGHAIVCRSSELQGQEIGLVLVAVT